MRLLPNPGRFRKSHWGILETWVVNTEKRSRLEKSVEEWPFLPGITCSPHYHLGSRPGLSQVLIAINQSNDTAVARSMGMETELQKFPGGDSRGSLAIYSTLQLPEVLGRKWRANWNKNSTKLPWDCCPWSDGNLRWCSCLGGHPLDWVVLCSKLLYTVKEWVSWPPCPERLFYKQPLIILRTEDDCGVDMWTAPSLETTDIVQTAKWLVPGSKGKTIL